MAQQPPPLDLAGAGANETTSAAPVTGTAVGLPASNGGLAPMPEKDIFEQYGEEISSRNIVGQLLKFSKGDWMYGQEGADFQVGKKMIANMDQLMLGWIRWEEQKPADQRMGLLVEGFRAPDRDTLGYGYEPGVTEPDTSEWELDEQTKQPRDPWQFTYYLVMKDPDIKEDGEGVFTFTSSSSGGKTAIGDLCKVYGRKRREGYKEHYPVVALKVGKYKHSNPQFGWIKVPVLPVIGWAAKAVFGDLPAPMDATEQLAKAAAEDIPF